MASVHPVPVTVEQIMDNIKFWRSDYIKPFNKKPANIKLSNNFDLELEEMQKAANFLMQKGIFPKEILKDEDVLFAWSPSLHAFTKCIVRVNKGYLGAMEREC
jgi:hypothetical protein